jgi:hypothetical protein
MSILGLDEEFLVCLHLFLPKTKNLSNLIKVSFQKTGKANKEGIENKMLFDRTNL